MLHRKLRIGDLIYDLNKKKIVCFNTSIIKEIEANNDTHNYGRIPLNSKWLKEVFEFDSKYLTMQSMTVYTSRINSLKIHEQHLGFFLSCTFRDGLNNVLGRGSRNWKPKVKNKENDCSESESSFRLNTSKSISKRDSSVNVSFKQFFC